MDDYLDYGGIRDRQTIAILNSYFKDTRMDYDGSGNLIYWGVNFVHKNDTAATDWEIRKYTYGANGITRIEGPLKGAWDDRATLDWA